MISDAQLEEGFALAGGSYYAYDLDAMGAHLRSLQAPGLKLWYACKANPLRALLAQVKESGFAFDVASPGEMRQALRAGADPKQMLLTGPVKTDAFLNGALEAGIEWFVVESLAQLTRINTMAASRGVRVNALVRLQLSWEGAGASVLGGSKVTAFGMGAEDWGRLPDLSHIAYRGVHVFQWGNILSAAHLGTLWASIAAQAKAFASSQEFSLDVLDLGGGIGISYKDSSKLDWASLVPHLAEARRISGAGALWMELGRYAAGPFGTYVSRVEERKRVRGEDFLLLSGGSHHMVRPALVNEPFPARVLGGASETPQTFHVHGPLCTALDRLGTYSFPSETKEGDLLAFSQSGAYGFTESMPYFLCHELAGELVWRNGKWAVERKPENPEIWLR
jgi:diaminopimelate decarboxylase